MKYRPVFDQFHNGLITGYEIMATGLSFDTLRAYSVDRCETSYNGINRWSPTDWGCALAGETGELCNVLKKMLRNKTSPGIAATPYEELYRKAKEELADVVIYADLLAKRLDIDLGLAVIEKFNRTSVKIGSSIMLPE